MLRFLRYCISHCLQAAMTRSEEVNGEASMWSSVRWLGYSSGSNSLSGLCLGLYARWVGTTESVVLVIFVSASLVLGTACVLYYFLDMERFSSALLHSWFGFSLGSSSFVNPPASEADVKERAANYSSSASSASRMSWASSERSLGCARYRPAFLTSAERQESAGFAAASTVSLIEESLSVTVSVVALAAVMITSRTKALSAFPNLVFFAAVSADVFFKSSSVGTNPFALACFFTQLICDPFSDFCLSGSSVTERWRSFSVSSGSKRRSSLSPSFVIEVAFISSAAQKFTHSVGRWYLVIPGFVVCALFWAICHMVFVITVWGFHTKLSDCQRVCCTQGPEYSSSEKIMASKGMRHFCLMSVRSVSFASVSTVAVTCFSWQESSGIFMSAVSLISPSESSFHGLFYESGNSSGGTCVGYAVVIPTNFCSPDGQPSSSPPDQVHESNKRSTSMSSGVQRFFAYHMIENHGCDYSTSGVSSETSQAKVKSFSESRTADGPRHDTYVIFYSGHTNRSGEWASAGGDVLRSDQLLEWWREKNGSFCSRLIVISDCEHSLPWVKEVRHKEGVYVAVQGASVARAEPPQLGDFTAQWVDYNCNPSSSVRWSERGRAVSAAYGVSKHWSDYTSHSPTGSDLTNHWSMYFPRVTYPVVQSASWCGGSNSSGVGGFFSRYSRRVKSNWFPPAVSDTESGFKSVSS